MKTIALLFPRARQEKLEKVGAEVITNNESNLNDALD